MPLFLITGLPGSGKTTVWRELKARGYEAYDGDKDHLARWYNNQTGVAVKEELEARTVEFVRTHSRNISREIVEGLAAQARDKPIFLCNDPMNEAELRELFAQVFALVVDEKTLKHRLAKRVGDDEWGKVPHELERVLASQQTASETYREFGYTLINATQPVGVMVDLILEKAGV